MRKVAAPQGFHWLAQALRLTARGWTSLLPIGLLMVLITQIPWLGTVVALLLGPALLGGLVWAVAQTVHGVRPGPGALFKAFDGSHRLPALVALCVPSLGLLLLLTIAMMGILGGAAGGDPARLEALQRNPVALLQLLRGHLGPLLAIGLAGGLLSWALTFFALPQVMLRQAGGFAAMGQSLRAALRNAGALLLLLLGLLGLAMLAGLVLQVLLLAGSAFGVWWRLLVWLLFIALLYAFTAALMYVAWRDVFDDAAPMQAQAPAAGEVHAEM